jgi:hypothetical protein
MSSPLARLSPTAHHATGILHQLVDKVVQSAQLVRRRREPQTPQKSPKIPQNPEKPPPRVRRTTQTTNFLTIAALTFIFLSTHLVDNFITSAEMTRNDSSRPSHLTMTSSDHFCLLLKASKKRHQLIANF